ncbi:sulfate adenylyltransferase subunit 1 [Vitreimonas flagellata]|uniref:sulfate adenylyltransferase subunit 1 n=1 Tax=Vitreimonas flagellata TaxID=2560861 RepID=UPI00107503C9|nr:GTP-binding protein [Vitreimonas flagellata]
MDSASYFPPAQNWSGEQVRFMTAGSVDDGKSTLIGRLLLDSKVLMLDQAAGLDGEDIDLAALTDGLEAERAQGITIDVAYRYFATPRTSFIIADSPGHEQYTRNMVTAASVSDVAVIVIDVARVEQGQLKPQTRRHAAVAALMGLNIIVAVNKMDLVGWSQARFDEVRAAFNDVAGILNIKNIAFVPVSAKRGENIVNRGGPDWYNGPTLIELLEDTPRKTSLANAPLRLPVQLLLRDGDIRLYAGRIESGAVKPGDKVRVGPGAFAATVAQVRIGGAGVAYAEAGASVAVELAEDRDLAQGGVIADNDVRYARRVVADLCWLDENAWTPARRYRLRQGALETQALIENVRFVRDVSNLDNVPANELKLNDIASVQLAARDPILADLFAELPGTGAFVLFDPDTNQTAAAGMIREIVQ